MSSKISVSSIGSWVVGKTKKSDSIMLTKNYSKEPEIKINEPNMIINPQKYLDSENKEFNDIANNIINEHTGNDIPYLTLSSPI